MPVSWTKDDELIAVHVKEGKVTVSGNDFLLGQNIQVCPPGNLGTSSDDLYFDSSGCGGRAETQKRQFGTFNTILMKFDITNTNDNPPLLITGRFTCTKIDRP
jgi:hypothetical protein